MARLFQTIGQNLLRELPAIEGSDFFFLVNPYLLQYIFTVSLNRRLLQEPEYLKLYNYVWNSNLGYSLLQVLIHILTNTQDFERSSFRLVVANLPRYLAAAPVMGLDHRPISSFVHEMYQTQLLDLLVAENNRDLYNRILKILRVRTERRCITLLEGHRRQTETSLVRTGPEKSITGFTREPDDVVSPDTLNDETIPSTSE